MKDERNLSGRARPSVRPKSASSVVSEAQALFSQARLVDLCHVLEEGMPTYPTHTKYFRNPWRSKGDVARMNQLILGDHTGTHVDSPCHFPVSGPYSEMTIERYGP